MPEKDSIDLHQIISVIRRWWWLIILTTFLAAAAAYIVISRMSPVYQASTTLLISPAQSSTASQYTDLMASERLALTYSQMLKDRPVLATVTAQLGLKQSTGQLAGNIQTQPVRDTQLIRLTVSDSDPVRAATIANTLAQVFKARVEILSAERYATTIKNGEDRVDNLQTQVGDLEAQIELLRSQKVENDVSLANKQVALDALLKDQQTLQGNQQQMELTISSVTGNVYIFEPVQVKTVGRPGTSAASAVVSVGQIKDISGTSPTNANPALTFGQLIIKTPMLESIIKDLGLTETPDQLANKITLEPVENTQLIRLTVEDADASHAEQLGQALVNAFITQVKDLASAPYTDRLVSLEAQLNDIGSSIAAAQSEIGKLTFEIAQLESEISRQETLLTENRTDLRESQKDLEAARITSAESSDVVMISEPAQVPMSPIQNRMLYVAVAGLVGFVIGGGFAFLLEFIDDRIRTDKDVHTEFDLPTLGKISRFTKKTDELVVISQPSSLSADDFWVLSTQIRRLCEKQAIHSLLITSSIPMEGKSVIVSNLALALAKNGLDVIIVDADMRLPRLHEIFALDQGLGLAHSLSNGNVNGWLQNSMLSKLRVLTSGGTPPNPAELLTSPNLEKLVKKLAGTVNIVLVDGPPVLSAADAAIVAQVVDGVLLVLKAGESESQIAQSAVETLRQAKANIVGVVLNAVPDRKEKYYQYYRNAEGKG